MSVSGAWRDTRAFTVTRFSLAHARPSIRLRFVLSAIKGGLKAKRLSQLTAPLWGDSARRGLGDSYHLVGLKDLRLGKNKGVAVALKVGGWGCACGCVLVCRLVACDRGKRVYCSWRWWW